MQPVFVQECQPVDPGNLVASQLSLDWNTHPELHGGLGVEELRQELLLLLLPPPQICREIFRLWNSTVQGHQPDETGECCGGEQPDLAVAVRHGAQHRHHQQDDVGDHGQPQLLRHTEDGLHHALAH